MSIKVQQFRFSFVIIIKMYFIKCKNKQKCETSIIDWPPADLTPYQIRCDLLMKPKKESSHLCFSCCTEVWHIQTQTDRTGWSSGPNPAPDPPGHCLPVWGCCCMGQGPGCRMRWSRCHSRPAGRPRQPWCWWCCRWGCRWTPCCVSPLGSGNWEHRLLDKGVPRYTNSKSGYQVSLVNTSGVWFLTVVISVWVQFAGAAVDGVFAVVSEVWGGPGVGEPRVVPHVWSQQVRPWMSYQIITFKHCRHTCLNNQQKEFSYFISSLPSVDDSRSFTVGETHWRKRSKNIHFSIKCFHCRNCITGFWWLHENLFVSQ